MTMDDLEVLVIHRCKLPTFTGNKIVARINLPPKCKANICPKYGMHYGTCTATGDKCTMCGKYEKRKRYAYNQLEVGEHYYYISRLQKRTRRVVLDIDIDHVIFEDETLETGDKVQGQMIRRNFMSHRYGHKKRTVQHEE